MGSRICAPALAALLAVSAAPAFAQEEPLCPGGTTLVKSGGGTDLAMHCQRRDGKKHGPYLIYDTRKMVVFERGEYHSGHRHGDYSRYDPATGKLVESGPYREGSQHGWWTTYHPNGKIASAGEKSGGRKRGRWTFYDATTGKVIEDGEYRDDWKHGFWQTYDPKTGKPLKQTEWVKGTQK